MTREEMQAHAEALQADWPQLTSEQLDRLAVLLRPRARTACCDAHDGPHVHGCRFPREGEQREHAGACLR